MGIHYDSFGRRGVDLSQYNGKVNWDELSKKADYVILRIGYGDTIDPRFIEYIEGAIKTNLGIVGYFYGDYYSNWFNKYSPAFGLTDQQWGIRQANNCIKWIMPYIHRINDVFLDVENVTVVDFPKLSDPIAKVHAQNNFRAFLERLDLLKVKNGIYASLGWLSWFNAWFRTKMLWVAFYPFRTADVDVSDIVFMTRKNGWLVDPVMWQYASDGDQDDNGTSDGVSFFGTSNTKIDLNGWIGTTTQYLDLFGAYSNVTTPLENSVVVTPPTVPDHTSGIYQITATPYLFIREKPSADIGSNKLGLFYPQTKVSISAITGDWGKITGQDGYIYLELAKKVS